MPAESDEEYVQELSDDEVGAHTVSRGKKNGTATETRGGGRSSTRGFDLTRSWETVVESADGTISGSVKGILDATKKKRVLKDTTPLQRGIIRHLVLIIDFSEAMLEKDMRPTRHLLTIRYTQEFVTEYFEQNPISQLAILGMKDGLAFRVSDMGGNPIDHRTALQEMRRKDPSGQASLQNALEMARGSLYHSPSHGTREILLIMGSLLSADPGDIHQTIAALVSAHITATVIGLAAEIAICRTLVTRTNPSLNSTSTYNVAKDEIHYRELVMAATTPPPTAGSATEQKSSINENSLLMMGFPSRIVENAPSLCACHSQSSRGGYLCSRCGAKVCALPINCPTCSLTLILSTHLARSYHHLFPLRNWKEVSWDRARQKADQVTCFGCMLPFPKIPNVKGKERSKEGDIKKTLGKKKAEAAGRDGGVSESERYECETCGRLFCIDCDVFCHEVVHNCPGCQSREAELMHVPQEDGSGAMEGVEVTETGMNRVQEGNLGKQKLANGQA